MAIYTRGRATGALPIHCALTPLNNFASRMRSLPNILCSPQKQLFMIDWDEALLAPKERDLMFIVNGTIGASVVRAEEEARFFRGYWPTDINWPAIAYYRYEWVVQEIGDFGELLLLRNDVGRITQETALQDFQALFQPGDVVDAAYRSEEQLRRAVKNI
ncbi:MAG: hypothetical protein GY801_00460 [bacterium]|nr:hypothetical protein [bacterium]